jgi:hypothetical protein
MPSIPTISQQHVNQPLTNMSLAFEQELERFFIAAKVFPQLNTRKQRDFYYRYNRNDWHRLEAQVRPLHSESAGGGYRLDTDNYYAEVYALHKDIDDRERANEDNPPLDGDADATRYLTEQMWLKREKEWATAFFATSLWTGSTTGGDITPGTKWDASGSTPIKDMRAQITSMHKKTGRRANTLTLAQDVWDALQDNADFIDRISVNTTRIVTKELLAQVLELDNVYVGGAIETTTAEGAATQASNFVMTDGALLTHTPRAPGRRVPAAGYTFAWTGLLGAAAGSARISRFRMEHLRSDRIEAESAYDQKQVAPDLGVYFTAVLT